MYTLKVFKFIQMPAFAVCVNEDEVLFFLRHEINKPYEPNKPNSLFPIQTNKPIYSLKSHKSKKS